MKIAFASDLHLEFQGTNRKRALDFPNPDTDVIVLAGDISSGVAAAEKALALAEWFPEADIVWLAGNHEFYGGSIDALLARYRRMSATHERVHFLENDTVTIKGVRFVGCTLWTDFSIAGDQEGATVEAGRAISDFRLIRTTTGESFTPDEAIRRFTESRAFLERELAVGNPESTVVVTHFPPGLETRNTRFRVDAITTDFQVNVMDLIEVSAGCLDLRAQPLWHGSAAWEDQAREQSTGLSQRTGHDPRLRRP